jgi:hypothetical protein
VGPRMPPENFPAPGQQSQDDNGSPAEHQAEIVPLGRIYPRAGGANHPDQTTRRPVVEPVETPHHVPNAASVLASTAAQSSARSSPRAAAIDRIVSGTR